MFTTPKDTKNLRYDLTIECLSHAPLLPGHGTLILKKKSRAVVHEEGQIIFWFVWIVPWITHMMVGNLKVDFPCNERWNLSSNSKIKCHQYRHGRQFSRFHSVFQDKGKSINRGENYKSGHVKSCSCSKGELVRGGKMLWCQLRDWCCLYIYIF